MIRQNDEKVRGAIWVDKLSDDTQRTADEVLSAMVEIFNSMGGYEGQTGDEHGDGEKYRWC
jgi:hypothetical protein